MPIKKEALAVIGNAYVEAMTSIRGRRTHRLIMREFAVYDHVVRARAADDTPALLALQLSGKGALLTTDGRGKTVSLIEWGSLESGAVITEFDFLKDSLPIIGWEVHHPGFEHGVGPVTIMASDLEEGDLSKVSDILRRLRGEMQ